MAMVGEPCPPPTREGGGPWVGPAGYPRPLRVRQLFFDPFLGPRGLPRDSPDAPLGGGGEGPGRISPLGLRKKPGRSLRIYDL